MAKLSQDKIEWILSLNAKVYDKPVWGISTARLSRTSNTATANGSAAPLATLYAAIVS
ncbi:MAG: hypothetical protein K2M83_04420 [Muribaculaceae bacterium]|nr:hypothetical protein [Muribaculaceae bacterium]